MITLLVHLVIELVEEFVQKLHPIRRNHSSTGE